MEKHAKGLYLCMQNKGYNHVTSDLNLQTTVTDFDACVVIEFAIEFVSAFVHQKVGEKKQPADAEMNNS